MYRFALKSEPTLFSNSYAPFVALKAVASCIVVDFQKVA